MAGAFVLSLIATGKAGFDLVQSGFAANGYAGTLRAATRSPIVGASAAGAVARWLSEPDAR